jgi:hypothetical protein
MNPIGTRRQVSEAAIVLAVCAGAWSAFVGPLHARLAAAQGALAAARTEIQQHTGDGSGAGAADAGAGTNVPVSALEARAAELDRLSARCGSAPAVYDTLMALAQEQGVRIDRLQPRIVGRRGEKRPTADQAVEPIGFTVDVTGDYEAVARFVAAIQDQGETTAVTASRIAPAPGALGTDAPATTVAASIETEHYHLSKPVRPGPTAPHANPGSTP